MTGLDVGDLIAMGELPADPFEGGDVLATPPTPKAEAKHSPSKPGSKGTRAVAALPAPVRETHLGNAVRLAADYGENLRHSWEMNRWFVWTGTHWAQDGGAGAMQAAKAVVRAMATRKALTKHANKSASAAALTAMVNLTKDEPGIPISVADLNRNPYILPAQNATIDLRSGDAREHRREDMATHLAPVDYDPAATCPTWEAFLHRIFAGDEDLIAFIQRAAGWSLTGDVSEHALLFCHGGGRNGKGTFTGALQSILGGFAQVGAEGFLMASHHKEHATEMADLLGARMVVCSEVDLSARFNEARMKALTGGDKIKGRYMRGDFFEFEPTHSLWLLANHKPRIRGMGEAIRSRIKLIPFDVTIPAEERDPSLPAKLRSELSGILNWCLEGSKIWAENGLGSCSAVEVASNRYMAEADVLATWIEDCCFVNAKASESFKALRANYEAWCATNAEDVLKSRTFGAMLTERGFRAKRGAKGVRLRTGIRIRTATDPEPESPESHLSHP